ncbi:hypothetical protein BVX97_06170 [bacterium E08(2017)]|nr:hypothetical protein BVX97_06170 [bacterium E08(2017)]
MRVRDLAKELGVGNQQLMVKLSELGVEINNHEAEIEEDAIELMREEFANRAKAEAATKPAAKSKSSKKKEPVVEAPAEPADDDKVIRVVGGITVKELAEELGVPPNKLIAELMGMKILATVTERLETKVVKEIAERHGFTFEHEKKAAGHSESLHQQTLEAEEEEEDRPEDLQLRPPVVTFLGHVDHGKTSLLDNIKNTAVAKGESGGITQHIGAYSVEVSGRVITFLDTPGHEAFNAMRARGANLTDIAVIIIAADDGIMPQTKEAIRFATEAGVTMIVAINKMDLPGADANKVKQQLQADGMTSEDWGGDLICCEVSAETGDGIPHLLEMILLQADVLELQANPKRRAQGYVIESQLEAGQGPTANVLISNGTLKIGDFVLCGPYCGKVKALIDDKGVSLKSRAPGYAVKLLGLSGVPEAGAELRVYGNEKVARMLADELMAQEKEGNLTNTKEASVEALFKQIEESRELELRVIVKADTQGSLEAITHSLDKIKSTKVSLNIILSGTGNLTVNDISLAGSSDAMVLGFHVGKEQGVKAAAKHEGVEFYMHEIIYELIDQVKDAMTALLPPLIEEHKRGEAEVRQIFPVGKKDNIAGCLVVSGYVTPQCKTRVIRDKEPIFEGTIGSLKHFQNDVKQVKESQECGIRIAGFAAIKEGDILEFYELEEKKQAL